MSQKCIEIPTSVMTIARQKANQLKAKLRISRDDVDDVEQSLLVKWIQSLPAYDPAKASVEAYAQVVFNSAAANFLRDRWATKRSPAHSVSLHVTVKLDDGEYGELAATIGQRELAARTGTCSLGEQAASGMKLDVADVLAELPCPDQELLHRLKWRTVAQTARDLGVPPTTVHSRLAKFRHMFEDAGLREYLQ